MVKLRRIMVLGSNSFTGGHLIRHALDFSDCLIMGISRSPEYHPVMSAYQAHAECIKRFSFHRKSLNDDLEDILGLCDKFKPDAVFNFAAQGEVRNSWNWPEQWYQTNCMGVVRLATELVKREYIQKYVVASTPEVYGSTGEAIFENNSFAPSTPYAASKLSGDLHLGVLHKRYGFPAVFTRAANVYGAHQQLYRIIPRTMIYAKTGRKVSLHGGGVARRAFIHGHDVAEATWQAAMKGRSGEVYHLSSDNDLRTIRSVVELILKQLGRSFEDHVELQDENYGQDDCFSLDSSKAQRELGWNCKVQFEDGVEQVVKWISDHWDEISKMELDYVHQP